MSNLEQFASQISASYEKKDSAGIKKRFAAVMGKPGKAKNVVRFTQDNEECFLFEWFVEHSKGRDFRGSTGILISSSRPYPCRILATKLQARGMNLDSLAGRVMRWMIKTTTKITSGLATAELKLPGGASELIFHTNNEAHCSSVVTEEVVSHTLHSERLFGRPLQAWAVSEQGFGLCVLGAIAEEQFSSFVNYAFELRRMLGR